MHSDDPRNIFFNQRYSEQPQKEQQDKAEQPPKTETNNKQGYDEKLAEMKRLAAKYEREGEGQLVKDILDNVLEQKAAGKLSNEQLLTFAKRVSPLLNADQRARLNALVEQLLKL